MPQRIVAELQALIAETRRKYPAVRQVAEDLLQSLHSNGAGTIQELQQCTTLSRHRLLQSVVLACETRAPKVVQIALALLQRGIVMKCFPDAALPVVLETMQGLVAAPKSTDIDIQLKILQNVSALLSMYAAVTGPLLSQAMMMCFTLYEHSRVAVVSSTAAATLRQNIMAVFEKVHDEDRVFDAIQNEDAAARAPLPAHTAQLPGGPVTLFPSSSDAYLLLSDLCALADGEPASFLPLVSLAKAFVMELLESVLVNHPRLFSEVRHPELVYVLRSAACPLLIKALSEHPPFPVYVRAVRLVRLLLRDFSEEVMLEIEILLRALLRTTDDTHTPWQRALAWETVRALCAERAFLQRLWDWYDGRPTEDAPSIVADLVAALHATALHARPQLAQNETLAAAVCLRHPPPSEKRRRHSLYDAAVAGVRSAAEGLRGTPAKPESLSLRSAPLVPLLDQLDKTEAPATGSPALPSTYVPLLVLQALAHLSYGLATLPSSHQSAMMRVCLAPASEGLLVCLAVQGADAYYEQVLHALAHLIRGASHAGLETERDDLLLTLADIAVPPAAYDGHSLAPRHLAAQAVLAHLCARLGPSLGAQWPALLPALIQALGCLRQDEMAHAPALLDTMATLPAPDGSSRWLAPATLETLPRRLRGVFAHAATWEDDARQTFAEALLDLASARCYDASASSTVPSIVLAQVKRFWCAAAASIAERMPDGIWPTQEPVSRLAADHTLLPERRLQAVQVLAVALDDVYMELPANAPERQRDLVAVLAKLAELDQRTELPDLAVRNVALSALHQIVQHDVLLLRGWDIVLHACETAPATTLAVSEDKDKVALSLCRSAFACVQLACQAQSKVLSDDDVRLVIKALASLAQQEADHDMALAAIDGLWDLAPQLERRARKDMQTGAQLWVELLQSWRRITNVAQPDKASRALTYIFRTLEQNGGSWRQQDWQQVLEHVLFPLLRACPVSPEAVLGSTRAMLSAQPLHNRDNWPELWAQWLAALESAYANEPAPVAKAVVAALSKMSHQDMLASPRVWRLTWDSVLRMCGLRESLSLHDLSSLAELLQTLYEQRSSDWSETDVYTWLSTLSRGVAQGLCLAAESDLPALQGLASQFRKTLSVIGMTCQAGILSALHTSAAAALVSAKAPTASQAVQAAYVELVESWLELWLAAYEHEPNNLALYEQDVPAMLDWLVQPLEVDDMSPLLSLRLEAVYLLVRLSEPSAAAVAQSDHAELYWDAYFRAVSSALCAPATRRPSASEDERVSHLLNALERVLPYAGADTKAHAALRAFLQQLLAATTLYQRSQRLMAVMESVPRERTSYAVWNLLFRLVTRADTQESAFVASEALAPVLDRCRELLDAYVADLRIRGAMPLPRVRVEEINYLLQQLRDLSLPDGVALPTQPLGVPRSVAHLSLLGASIESVATTPLNTSAIPQRATIGSSLDAIPQAPRTTPSALAREVLVRRRTAPCT